RTGIWISFCPLDAARRDMRTLTTMRHHHLLAEPEYGWEDVWIGGGAPPVHTPLGWLLIYHAVRHRPPRYPVSPSRSTTRRPCWCWIHVTRAASSIARPTRSWRPRRPTKSKDPVPPPCSPPAWTTAGMDASTSTTAWPTPASARPACRYPRSCRVLHRLDTEIDGTAL